MIIEDIEKYKQTLNESELKEATIKQYEGYLKEFIEVEGINNIEDIDKNKLLHYKEYLQENFAINTINIKITILNAFLLFHNFDSDIRLKHLKKQHQTTIENVLNQSDYSRISRMALKKNKVRMYYLMETLYETGIRISELQYITFEAVKKEVAIFNNKGTFEKRAYISKNLKKKLLQYCKMQNITSGIIFRTRTGKPLDSAYVYKEIQKIAGQARVKLDKAHPHSFRHLFANIYLEKPGHNIADLQNILGHQNIATTGIYLKKRYKDLKKTLND